jgi:hypothetical protein
LKGIVFTTLLQKLSVKAMSKMEGFSTTVQQINQVTAVHRLYGVSFLKPYLLSALGTKKTAQAVR